MSGPKPGCDKPCITPEGDNDLMIDDLAHLCECWAKHRKEGRTPKSIKAAIVLMVDEVAGKDKASLRQTLQAARAESAFNHRAQVTEWALSSRTADLK